MNPRTSLFVTSAIVSIFITAGCPQKAPTESAADSAQESAGATGLPGPVAIPIRETVVDSQVKLSWGAMPGATAYAVYFGTASGPPFVRTIATTSTTVVDLQYCNTYYWRIEAIYVQGRGASAVESFRTFCPADAPAVPHYPAPANRAAAVPQSPTLSWNATAKATRYEVYFGETENPPLVADTNTTQYSVSRELHRGQRYYWRVAAANDAGATKSPVWSFVVLDDPAGPPAPSPLSPPDTASDVRQRVRLDWTDAAGATGYDVELGTAADALALLARGPNSDLDITTPLALNTTYYWRTIARNNEGANAGPLQTFTTVPFPAAPLPASNPYPPDDATWISRGATLTWSKDPAVTRYDVYFGTTNPPPFATSVTESRFTSAAQLDPATMYYWRIDAANEVGATTGATWHFMTSSALTLGGGDPGAGGPDDPGTDPDPGPGEGPYRSAPYAQGACNGTITQIARGTAPFVSSNGRFVAFVSTSAISPADINRSADIYVFDRTTHLYTRASVSSSGAEARGVCSSPSLSADGRYCAFVTTASLADGDADSLPDAYVHDLVNGLTYHVSIGIQGGVSAARIAADAQLVLFESPAGVALAGFGGSVTPVVAGARIGDLSADARHITYLLPGSLEVIDRQQNDVTLLVSVGSRPIIAGNASAIGYIAFLQHKFDLWVANRDDSNRRKMQVPLATTNYLCWDPDLSDNGLVAAYSFLHYNGSTGETEGRDIVIADAGSGVPTNLTPDANGVSDAPSLSGDGSVIAFTTKATNLVDGHNPSGSIIIISCGGN